MTINQHASEEQADDAWSGRLSPKYENEKIKQDRQKIKTPASDRTVAWHNIAAHEYDLIYVF
ncbi:MAG: hypothetical protein H6618_04195 [Deltaproteobacteria bacterium]|nr:hypothetical protein [Deltaproteobacteria bacterium]